jgi:hypothetical protein
MKYIFTLLTVCFSISSVFASEVKINVTLSPAGSFEAITKRVKGYAYKTPSGVAAKNVLVDVRSLDTDMELRNKHMKERLDAKKYPVVKLIKAIGKNGKGDALIEVKGIKKKYSGTYTINGKELEGTFKMKLSEIGIKDVSYMSVGVNDEVAVHITLPLKDKMPSKDKK